MRIVTTTPARLRAEEFAEWVRRPENVNRWFELVRGEVIELPPPTKVHGVVCMNAGYVLGGYVRQRGLGYLTSNDSGVILERDPDTVRGPDVALYEDARHFDELHPKYGETPPVLAGEVMSPGDRIGRVMAKVADYMGNGVRLVWLIDPEERNVTAYRPDRTPVVVRSGQELADEDVLPGFRCSVDQLFFVPGASAPPPEPS